MNLLFTLETIYSNIVAKNDVHLTDGLLLDLQGQELEYISIH